MSTIFTLRNGFLSRVVIFLVLGLLVAGCGRQKKASMLPKTAATTSTTQFKTPATSAEPEGIVTENPVFPKVTGMPWTEVSPFLGTLVGQCPNGDNLNSEALANGRNAWIRKCVPAIEMWISIAENALVYNTTNRRFGYLTFNQHDGNSNTTNPLNYKAPTSDTAACNLPLNYVVTHVCYVR